MYTFWGKIRKHNQRGKKLGFPTANINLTKNIPEGIYVSQTKVGTSIYTALTFIGQAKTFNEKSFHAETYILDFNQNIYGKWISIKLLKKIRGNKKFNSSQDLVAQMKKDEREAREYFKKVSEKLPSVL
ncbi:MAG: riboflavin kinase [Candidatus Daviesbacteria bacterium]|nr:riboflavin kinase [Candidatus Daviesbacteria bacterium]